MAPHPHPPSLLREQYKMSKCSKYSVFKCSRTSALGAGSGLVALARTYPSHATASPQECGDELTTRPEAPLYLGLHAMTVSVKWHCLSNDSSQKLCKNVMRSHSTSVSCLQVRHSIHLQEGAYHREALSKMSMQILCVRVEIPGSLRGNVRKMLRRRPWREAAAQACGVSRATRRGSCFYFTVLVQSKPYNLNSQKTVK